MTAADVEHDAALDGHGPARSRLRWSWRRDAPAVTTFIVIAFWVSSPLWLHPGHVTSLDMSDEAQNEWFLAHGVRVWEGHEGLFHSDQIGVPHGINLMANASILGLALPMAPLTLLLGPRVVFALLTFLGLSMTPTGWYFLLSRRLRHRWAGWAGAMIAGLSPGMITNASGHLNLMCQFLVPVLVWRALKLVEPGRAVRNGMWLAAVALWQLFISSEVLVLTTISVSLFMMIMAAVDSGWRTRWRQVLAGGAVAAAAGLAVAAYPIWYQFRGPGSYRSMPPTWRYVDANPFSYLFLARQSLFGSGSEAAPWAPYNTEEDALLGFPLVIATYAVVVMMRRNRTVVALTGVAVVAFVCSLGPQLVNPFGSGATPLPWALARHVPVLSAMVPTRFGMVVADVCGILVAIAVRAVTSVPVPRRRLATLGLTILTVIPNLPKPLPTTPVPGAPAFFNSADIRPYLENGGSLLFAPPTTIRRSVGMFWSAESYNQPRLAQGYFFSPGPGDVAAQTPAFRPLSLWLDRVSEGKPAAPPSARQAVADLRYWHTTAIVLEPVAMGDITTNVQESPRVLARLRRDLTRLLHRAPEEIDGVELWDVRDLTAAH